MNVIPTGVTVVRSDVELAADGDEVAFARLIERYQADMVWVACVVTGDASLSQDATRSPWTRRGEGSA